MLIKRELCTVHELGDIVTVSVGKATARGLRSQTRCFHSKTHNAEAKKLCRPIKENVRRPSAPLTRGFQLSGSLSCRFARLNSNSCSASSGVNFTTMPSRQITILVFDTRARSMTFRQASSNASSAFVPRETESLCLIMGCVRSLAYYEFPPSIVENECIFTVNFRDQDRWEGCSIENIGVGDNRRVQLEKIRQSAGISATHNSFGDVMAALLHSTGDSLDRHLGRAKPDKVEDNAISQATPFNYRSTVAPRCQCGLKRECSASRN